MTSTAANRLARLCAYSAQAPEWEEFVRVSMPVVALAARRVGAIWGDRSAATAHEIVQDVFVKLCEDERRILREFEDRGENSFLNLLRVVTATVGSDHFRRLRAEKRGGNLHSTSLQLDHTAHEIPDMRANEALELPSLMAQLDNLLRRNPARISVRDRKIFWLYYRQGMTAGAISRLPAVGLSADGVESALKRITHLLRLAVTGEKPQRRFVKNKSSPREKVTGFSQSVAIDNIEQR